MARACNEILLAEMALLLDGEIDEDIAALEGSGAVEGEEEATTLAPHTCSLTIASLTSLLS